MLKNYVKIALKVLLRRKFFTFVSLFGITFTLMVVMVCVALFNHLAAPAKAGSRFDRTLYVERIYLEGEGWAVESLPSYLLLDRYVRTMHTPEAVSIHSGPSEVSVYVHGRKLGFSLKHTDAVFWDIMEYRFLEGRPYDSLSVANADHVAVITDRTRRQIYGDEPALGEYLETTTATYRVVGVIPHEQIPTFASSGDIFVPVTTSRSAMTTERLFSDYTAYVLAADKSDFDRIKSEFQQRIKQVQEDNKGEVNTVKSLLGTQSDIVAAHLIGDDVRGGRFMALTGAVGMLVLFMLFPAINLVNINVSRIIERSSEIGVRKAFGASSLTLIGQFIVENVILTLLGGAAAYVLAWVVLTVVNDSGVVPWGHLGLNVRIFLYCLAATLFFGLFSGVLPAYKMSRLHPVEALKGGEQ
jgi:putative ABC transport system permease protein